MASEEEGQKCLCSSRALQGRLIVVIWRSRNNRPFLHGKSISSTPLEGSRLGRRKRPRFVSRTTSRFHLIIGFPKCFFCCSSWLKQQKMRCQRWLRHSGSPPKPSFCCCCSPSVSFQNSLRPTTPRVGPPLALQNSSPTFKTTYYNNVWDVTQCRKQSFFSIQPC